MIRMTTRDDIFKNNISMLAYELYKNYYSFRNNRTELLNCDIFTSKETFKETMDMAKNRATDKYIESYNEFFESIYPNEPFMKELLVIPELIDAYCESITKMKEYEDFATFNENDTFDEFKKRAYNIYHRYYVHDTTYDYFIEYVYPNEEFMKELLRERTLIDKYYDSLTTSNQINRSAVQTTDNTPEASKNIRHLAYMLYMQDDIPFEQRMDAQRNYTRYLINHPGTSFDDYIINHNYPDAKIPLESYDEFIQNAYFSSKSYIEYLLNDEDLIELYQKDIESNNDVSLPDAENIRELLRTAKTEINKLSNYAYGKPDRPSDLMDCGYIDGETDTWKRILSILESKEH